MPADTQAPELRQPGEGNPELDDVGDYDTATPLNANYIENYDTATPSSADEPELSSGNGNSGGFAGDGWWDDDNGLYDEILLDATPSEAVQVTVDVENMEGIEDIEPGEGEYYVDNDEEFTIVVTPQKYYKVSAAVTPEEVDCQETRAKDGTYTYTLSNLQEENTVTVTAEYLEAVAAYYAVVEEVEAFGDVTVDNIEEAVTLYKKLTPAHDSAQKELGTNTTALDTNYTNVRTSFAEKIKAVWKGDSDNGWYLILTHEAQGDDTFTPIKEYIYLPKSEEYLAALAEYEKHQSEPETDASESGTDTPKKTAAPKDTLKKDDPRLIALQKTFEGKVYNGNSIDDKGRDLPGAGGNEFDRPVEVTFYYTDAAGDGWSFDPETGTLTLTGDVTTTGADHPWAAFANEIHTISAPGSARIKICDGAFNMSPYTTANSKNTNGEITEMKGINKVDLTNVESIGENAFNGCKSLGEVKLNDVGRIGCAAFKNCTALTNVSLTAVKEIGDFAEDSSKDASEGAFELCYKLSELKLDRVQYIGSNSFRSCLLSNLEITGVIGIGSRAFYDSCLNLKKIEIPDSCQFIGANAFSVQKARLKTINTLIEIPENSSLTLGYSNIFSKMPNLIARMESLWDKTFSLNPITTPELSVPEGWTDSKDGLKNSTGQDATQLTKAARWTDDSKTKAEIELQFAHSKTPGKDILFLLDYSNSIAYPANYKDSKLYNIQFKTIDLIEDLFAEGYDNRVGVITFGGPKKATYQDDGTDGTVNTADFTTNIEELRSFVSTDYSKEENTSYTKAFNSAKAMIEGRGDDSRDVKIIFISDGVPYNEGRALPYEGDIKNAVDAVKALANVEIFSVLQADSSTTNADESMMLQIASAPEYYFEAEDTESFNDAVNAAIAAAYGTFTVTDTVGADFDLDTASVVARSYDADGKATVLSDEMLSSVSFSKDADGNDVITWELPALANTRYTLTFTENLKPDDAGKYPAGTFDTNTGDAEVKPLGANEAVNTVSTPQLSRDSYGITVHYLEKNTNAALAEDGKYTGNENEAYDISDLLNLQIEGYQIDSYLTVEGQTPQMQGTLTEDIEINVYYVKAPEPTDPEPTDPEPTDPEPTVPEPTDPEPTAPQPTEPEPTAPQPTEPQPTAPQPTEPEPIRPNPPSYTTPSPTPSPLSQGNGPFGPVQISDNETPLGAAPIQIEDTAIPMDAALVSIDDEEVPLASAPMTGDERPLGMLALIGALALGLMGVFGILSFRKKESE